VRTLCIPLNAGNFLNKFATISGMELVTVLGCRLFIPCILSFPSFFSLFRSFFPISGIEGFAVNGQLFLRHSRLTPLLCLVRGLLLLPSPQAQVTFCTLQPPLYSSSTCGASVFLFRTSAVHPHVTKRDPAYCIFVSVRASVATQRCDTPLWPLRAFA
jgi:hypothetical protein